MQSAVIMRKVCSAHCLRPRLRFVHSETDHMLLILGFERARRGATPKERAWPVTAATCWKSGAQEHWSAEASSCLQAQHDCHFS